MIWFLVNAFETFEKDSSLKVAVLTGNGGTFCAGFDLKELSNTKETYQSSVKIEDIVKPVGKGPG